MSETPRFRRLFDKQHVKRAQALYKSTSKSLYHIHRLLPRKLSCKKSLLLTCKMLGLLVNTLAANNMYLVLDKDNLTLPIQIQLSQKQNIFSLFFATFSKSTINFEYFEKKDDVHSFCISEITDSENVIR